MGGLSYISTVNDVPQAEQPAPLLKSVANAGAIHKTPRTIRILFSGPVQSNGLSRETNADTIAQAPHLPYDGYFRGAYYWNETTQQLEEFTTSHNQYLPDVNGDYGIMYQIVKRLFDAGVCDRIELYKYAKGGSSLGDADGADARWAVSPNGELTDGMLTMIANSGVTTFDYHFQFQGETDALSTTNSNNYLTNLQPLYDLLKANVNITRTMVIGLQPIPDFAGPNQVVVNQAQKQFVINNLEAHFIDYDTSGVTFIDPSHYPLTSHVDIGNLSADLMIMQLTDTQAPGAPTGGNIT